MGPSAVCALWCWLGTALAQEIPNRERAIEVLANGDMLFAEGNYEAARSAYEEVLRLSGEASMHFNIANCLELMGDLQRAYDELNLYRAVAPAEEQQTLDRRLLSIQKRIDALKPVPDVPTGELGDRRIELQPATVVLLGSGTGLGLVSLTGAALSWRGSRRHYDQNNREAYAVDRGVNVVSWLGLGVGASLALTGIVITGPAQTSARSLSIGVGGIAGSSSVSLSGNF